MTQLTLLSTGRGGRSRRALLGGAMAGAGALAVACAGGPGGGAAPQATKAVGGTLTAWMPPPTFTFREGIGADVAGQFKAANPGLNFDAVDEGSGEKLKTTVAAGTPPDFFHTQSYWQTTWGVTGVVQYLDNYIKAATNVRPQD